MSLMILKRFKNELIILLATIFVLSAFFYKVSAKNFVIDKKADIENSINGINRVFELKKLWADKQIAKDGTGLKSIVAKEKLKLFKKTGNRVTVSYSKLDIKELNMITKKIMNRAFQIEKLNIKESGSEEYSMELTCKW